MRAVRLHHPGGAIHVEDVSHPVPAGTEVRIRVAGCGVCHTDLHVVDGIQARVELPRTLGHEVAGWVDAFGPDAEPLLTGLRLAAGSPVVVYGGWGCGACRDCLGGAEQRCAASRAPGFQADGGYAEQMLVPHPRHLVPIGDLDPVRAAPLADAGITPFRAVRRATPWLSAGGRVLLIGAGGLGQFAIQYLRLLPDAGRDLMVAVHDRSAAHRERAIRLGADLALPDPEPTATLDALAGPADVVLDVVGTDATLALGAAVVAPDGLLMLVGEAGGTHPFGFDAVPVESWLTTVAWGSRDDLDAVVQMAVDARLTWDVETLALERAAEAHARLRAGEVSGRLVLVPGA